ncbi:methyltransferase domain-containing protein [Pyxidicoccus xibeiensis]|uniref:class I SAM-dependent methyltransferase n=1 Tax=Pyxidicoccus xibeiensis TaxID=2906759 RepID=UPI0020A75CB0|nr:class I SAM-dependent methyltransferase [Pyxidicoccus xibeiensis]MCP3141683.1 class I SAM-dependent methyltransferase [Pyxidicoccus xibeiensis]
MHDSQTTSTSSGVAPILAGERNRLVAPPPEPTFQEALDDARQWLDNVHERMLQAPDEVLRQDMQSLHLGLLTLRRRWSPEVWKRFCKEVARKHALRPFLHQCPFTRRAYERPRGYAGDAVLIDYLYMDHASDELHAGREIYRFMHQQPSSVSVRERRELLARAIDETAERVPGAARILSVACGHLREAESSRAVAERRVAELVAFDQDPLSLAEISHHNPHGVVKTQCGSVRALLSGKTKFSDMDFVYSAGLYDYLSDAVATRLTGLLFGMLRSGGRMVVANFAMYPPETGYMEAFMDWWLTYRDEDGMRALLGEVPIDALASVRLYRDSVDNVIYLELTRR